MCFFTFLGFLVASGEESGLLQSIIASGRLASIALIVVLIFWGMAMLVAASVFINQYFFKKEVRIKVKKFVKTFPKRYASLTMPFQLRKRSFNR